MSSTAGKTWHTTRTVRVGAIVVGLLALLGAAAYWGGWQLWAAHHLRLAQQALDQSDLAQARAHLRLCLEVWPHDAATHLLAARTARRADDDTDAARHLDECDRLGGPHEEIELERSLLLAQEGMLALVERSLVDRVEHNDPAAPLILEALTKGYARTSRLPLALYCTEKWLRLQPDNVGALFQQGLYCEKLFSPEKALANFRRVVELKPANEEARLHLAEALHYIRHFDEALPHFQQLVEANPGNAAALLGLARCEGALGHLDEAQTHLNQLLRARPGDGLALVERGKLALDRKELADAEQWLRKAVAVMPSGRTANYYLAQCLEQRGRHEEAQVYRTKLNQVDADWKRLEEVMHKLADAPLDTALRFEAGTLMLRVGQQEQGQRWLEGLLDDVPNHREAHQALAESYERAGNQALAARHRQFTP
jgi:tetratricopeptide (TPR) repeat protein